MRFPLTAPVTQQFASLVFLKQGNVISCQITDNHMQ